MDELKKSVQVAVSGMQAQAERLRVVSENMANADSLPSTPGAEPYRRKVISFKDTLDRETGVDKVKVDKVSVDKTAFPKKYDPKHPAADADGYVQTPNVNPLIELMDMREAQRTYEANMDVVTVSRGLLGKTIDLLK